MPNLLKEATTEMCEELNNVKYPYKVIKEGDKIVFICADITALIFFQVYADKHGLEVSSWEKIEEGVYHIRIGDWMDLNEPAESGK